MAHRGPAAQPRKLGHSANADWTDVDDVPYEGPSLDLPKSPGDGRRKWHDPVVAWWQQIRRMPHCALWTPTDWLFALETGYMKQKYWTDYSNGELHSTLATEIRRREDQMGCTREALRKLRIRYVPPVEDAESDLSPASRPAPAKQPNESDGATVTPIDERRRRLAG